VRPLLGFEVLHAGVLDADLLAQQMDLLLQSVGLGPSAAHPRVAAMEVPAREMT